MEREGTKDHKTKPNRVPVSVNSAYIDSAARSRCVETDFPVSCALFLSLQCLAWVFLGDDLATSLSLCFDFVPPLRTSVKLGLPDGGTLSARASVCNGLEFLVLCLARSLSREGR